MARATAIEKAISQLAGEIAQHEGEIAVLQAAIAKLRQQAAKAPVRRPKPVIAERQSA